MFQRMGARYQCLDFDKYHKISYPEYSRAEGIGQHEHLPMPSGAYALTHQINYQKDFIDQVETDRSIILHFSRKSDFLQQMEDGREYRFRGPGFTLFKYDQSVRYARRCAAGNNFERVTFSLPHDYLRRFLPDCSPNTTSQLAGYLNNKKSVLIESFPLNGAMQRVLEEIFTHNYRGHMRATYLQAKMLELLCYGLDFLDNKNDKNPQILLRPRDVAQLNKIHELLSQSYIAPPTLSHLCQHFNLNRNKLTLGFKMLFGQSVHEYCRSLRMMQANHLLHGSATPIASVAQQLGYESSSSFTRAYSKHFGYPPGKELQSR